MFFQRLQQGEICDMIVSSEVITMTCPKCQTICNDTDSFCYRCGASLTAPSVKKGTHIIPLLILTVMSVLGIVLFILFPMPSAESDTPWFSVTDGTLYFDPELYTGPSELTVPETVNGQTVTAIGRSCFFECSGLTTVILPDTVESIGAYAFEGCTSLRGIYIPESVTTIYACAFRDCSALEAVSLPGSLTTIGSHSFDGCEKLAYILFDGTHSQWEALYTDHINLHTHVYCTDGSYLHR